MLRQATFFLHGLRPEDVENDRRGRSEAEDSVAS